MIVPRVRVRSHACFIQTARVRTVVMQVAHAIASGLQNINASLATDELLIITALRYAGCIDGAPKGSLRPVLEGTAPTMPAPGTIFSCHPTMAMYMSLYQDDKLPAVLAVRDGAEELACVQHPVTFKDLQTAIWCKVGLRALKRSSCASGLTCSGLGDGWTCPPACFGGLRTTGCKVLDVHAHMALMSVWALFMLHFGSCGTRT